MGDIERSADVTHGASSRHLTPAHMRKAPRGDEAPWRRRSRGRKEAPWDIIGGMTDDRIAYQFAQRPSASCVSLWKNLPLDDGTGRAPLWSSPKLSRRCDVMVIDETAVLWAIANI